VRLFSLLVGVLLLPGCGEKHGDIAQSRNLISRLDVLIPSLLSRENIPGVQISIIDSGRVSWSKGYGFSNAQHSAPITDSSLFNIGSVSKSITSWAVMSLLKETGITVDSPVQDHLRRWQFPPSEFDSRLVTIRRLLSHTSGLSILPASESFSYPPTLAETLTKSFGSFGRLRLVHEPGTHFEYNNGNYLLLQMFIEDVSGIEFATYVKSKVLEPLGLVHTTYTPAGNGVNMYFAASGGVYTTAADLGKFVSASMTDGRDLPGRDVLTLEAVQEMIAPEEETGGRYGLGYKVLRLSDHLSLITNDGANPGYRAMFMAAPEQKVGVVILTNSDNGGRIVADIVCTWVDWETQIELTGLCNGEKPIPAN